MDDIGWLGDRMRKLQSALQRIERGCAPGNAQSTRRSKSAASASCQVEFGEDEEPAAVAIARRCSSFRPENELAWRRTESPHDKHDGSSIHPRELARRAGGLFQAARSGHPVPRLCSRIAARVVGLDAGGVDAPVRRRPRHHRAVHAGRHAIHAEIPVGAGRRRARRAAALRVARPAARLAGAVATPADGGDRVPRLLQSRGVAVAGCVRRDPGRHGVRDAGHRDRRVPGREPRTVRTSRRHGVLRRHLPHRHGGVGRRCALHRRWLRAAGLRPADGVDLRLSGDGRVCLGRHRHRDLRDRTAQRRHRRACRRQSVEARVRGGGCRVQGFPLPRHGRRDPRLRRVLQALRCVRRRDDHGVRDRSRLFTHRLR